MAADVMAAFAVAVVTTHTMAAASAARISIGTPHKRCHKYGQHDPDDSFHRIHSRVFLIQVDLYPAFRMLSMAETKCARWRRKSVPVWLIKKGCDALGSVCLV